MPSVRLESASEDKLYTVGKVDHDQLSRCLLSSHTLSYLVIHLLLFLFQPISRPYFSSYLLSSHGGPGRTFQEEPSGSTVDPLDCCKR